MLETEINGSAVFLRTQEPETETQMGCQVTWKRRLENYGHVLCQRHQLWEILSKKMLPIIFRGK